MSNSKPIYEVLGHPGNRVSQCLKNKQNNLQKDKNKSKTEHRERNTLNRAQLTFSVQV